MLRLYNPITRHDIFKLHKTLEHLVCDVWCEANNDSCESKMNADLKKLVEYSYKTGTTFGTEIERIYVVFKGLDKPKKDTVIKAFKQADQIEELCAKKERPIYLSGLDKVVEDDIKPLFKWCYEGLLNKKKVSGDKLKYYQELIDNNEFNLCPCCGLIDFESPDDDNEVREAYDHYLPKSKYPFASVNFKNLVPLCYKCNSERKKSKDPIENDRIAFYPFSTEVHDIGFACTYEIDIDKELNAVLKDLNFSFSGKDEELDTWNWLFAIKYRYNKKVNGSAKTFLREIKNRYRNAKKRDNDLTYIDFIEEEIELYNDDDSKYSDWKFLKIPILKELKSKNNFLDVYK